jgi:predicted nucleic acid-binding Zn ribbon protein
MIECILCGKTIPSCRNDINSDEAFCSDSYELELGKKASLDVRKRVMKAGSDRADLAIINCDRIIMVRMVD